MIPGHELKHLPIAEAMRVQRESIETEQRSLLPEARQETAVLRSRLAAMRDRELAQDAVIRELRHELIEAHDLLGRVEGAASAKSVPGHDWTLVPDGDRRRIGG